MITAASYPLDLADGTTYQFSPLTDKDIDEIDGWLQARVIENARRSLTPDMTQAERDELQSLAIRESLSVSLISPQGARMLATVQGMTRLVWQSVKRNHPGVTEDQIRAHMLSPENIQRANAAFSKVNNSGSKTETQRAGPKKGQRRKPARRR